MSEKQAKETLEIAMKKYVILILTGLWVTACGNNTMNNGLSQISKLDVNTQPAKVYGIGFDTFTD